MEGLILLGVLAWAISSVLESSPSSPPTNPPPGSASGVPSQPEATKAPPDTEEWLGKARQVLAQGDWKAAATFLNRAGRSASEEQRAEIQALQAQVAHLRGERILALVGKLGGASPEVSARLVAELRLIFGEGWYLLPGDLSGDLAARVQAIRYCILGSDEARPAQHGLHLTDRETTHRALITLVHHSESGIRRRALELLAQLKVRPSLFQSLLHHPDESLRLEAVALYLGAAPVQQEIFESLLQTLLRLEQSSRKTIRASATELLATSFADRKAVRLTLARQIQAGGGRSILAILAQQEAPDPVLLRMALTAVPVNEATEPLTRSGRIRPEALINALEAETASERQKLATLAANMLPRHMALTRAARQHPSRRVRGTALLALQMVAEREEERKRRASRYQGRAPEDWRFK